MPFRPGRTSTGEKFNVMRIRFFKQTRRFEVYFEMEEKRILDRFFDRRFENGSHEFWLGRFYLTFHIYLREAKVSCPEETTTA
ncbi:hypothetical protein GGI59_005155 [Rhizobium lentis]|uniref:Uncharacterized protein n=1 Tax=Rhizobium lentis TaxID=1138194 RepID=A0A7W8XIF2_9HYPH|nr:hypothetical protein [Rhizobium lentis]